MLRTTRSAVITILIASVAINAFLFWLIYFHTGGTGPEGRSYAWIPAWNATMNALSATFVVCGLWFIKQGNRRVHGVLMVCAMVASALFLVGYVIYHSLHGDTRFLTEGWIRPLYFFILITHIVLSVAVVPLILTTVYFAATRRWAAHRAIARWTYPIWLYVSITGILVFLFLRFWNVPTAL